MVFGHRRALEKRIRPARLATETEEQDRSKNGFFAPSPIQLWANGHFSNAAGDMRMARCEILPFSE
jgi:hypothetical protein